MLSRSSCHAAGSCLVLKGNGADVAMHCVPPVRAKRMSITLRRYVRLLCSSLLVPSGNALPGSTKSAELFKSLLNCFA